MLFNYSHCKCCKKEINEMRMILHNILPVNVCNKICEYNVYCEYCILLVKNERKFSKIKQEAGVSKIELQIRYFTLFNEPVFEYKELKNIKIRKINTAIDNSACEDIRFKKVMKSYFRIMYCWFNKYILPSIDNKQKLKDTTRAWKNTEFQYYNSCYRNHTIIRFILLEYLWALIDINIDFMEFEHIPNYLDEVFPKECKNNDDY